MSLFVSNRRSTFLIVVLFFLALYEILDGAQKGRNLMMYTSGSSISGSEKGHPNDAFKYWWVGDQWYSPSATVPRYTPIDMKAIFSGLNTLWIGDSNARQNMHTMFNLINASNAHDIDQKALQRDINFNKNPPVVTCWRADFSNNSVLAHHVGVDKREFQCLQIDDDIDRNSPGNSANYTSLPTLPLVKNTVPSKGKFDFLFLPCLAKVNSLMEDELDGTLRSLLGGYDILVLDFTIWEVVTSRCTGQWQVNENRTMHLLERLASPDFSVFWKTTGPSQKHLNSIPKLDKMNNFVREFFASQNPQHMHLIDWAEQMGPRSKGSDRINGDLPAHWGLQARLLAAQMVTHAVVTMQEQQKFQVG